MINIESVHIWIYMYSIYSQHKKVFVSDSNGTDSPAGPSHAGDEPMKAEVKRANKRPEPSRDESDQEKR